MSPVAVLKNTKPVEARINPAIISAPEPNLSRSLPDIGEPIAVAMTTGSSIKLAVDVGTPNDAIAIDGRNTNEAWKIPVPIAINPVIRICRTRKSLGFTTGVDAAFSTKISRIKALLKDKFNHLKKQNNGRY